MPRWQKKRQMSLRGVVPLPDFFGWYQISNQSRLEGSQSMFALRWTKLRYSHRSLCDALRITCRCQSSSVAPSANISPALLERARALAAEHARLAIQLNSEYDTHLARKAGSLSAVARTLSGWESANNVRLEIVNARSPD